VSTRDVFSEHELARLRGFPEEVSPEELIRFFTLSAADEAFVRSMRRPATVLAVAVQLCALPWLGFVPDEVGAAPMVAVTRLAGRLGISAGELAGYGLREQTRTDHLRMVMSYLGWRTADEVSVKELDEFLLARAMEHDAPSLLFRLACEHLITTRVVRPGPVKLSLFAVCGSHWSNYLAHLQRVADRPPQAIGMMSSDGSGRRVRAGGGSAGSAGGAEPASS